MHVLRPIITRPNVRASAKKTDFVSPTEAPGEGNRRFPSMDEPEKKMNPIKKFLWTFSKSRRSIMESSVKKVSGPLDLDRKIEVFIKFT